VNIRRPVAASADDRSVGFRAPQSFVDECLHLAGDDEVTSFSFYDRSSWFVNRSQSGPHTKHCDRASITTQRAAQRASLTKSTMSNDRGPSIYLDSRSAPAFVGVRPYRHQQTTWWGRLSRLGWQCGLKKTGRKRNEYTRRQWRHAVHKKVNAAILETYLMWTQTVLNAEIRKFLSHSLLQTVHVTGCVIPHTIVCEHNA